MEHRKSTSYTQTDCEEDYWSCVLRRKINSETYVRQNTTTIFQVTDKQKKVYGCFQHNSVAVHNTTNSMLTLNSLFLRELQPVIYDQTIVMTLHCVILSSGNTQKKGLKV